MYTLRIQDLIRIANKQRGMIACVVLLSAAITALISYFALTPRYEATATLLIVLQDTLDQIRYDEVMTNERLVPTYSQIIKSKRIARDVIKELKLNIPETELLERVRAAGVKNSLVTAITVSDPNPKQAAAIANAFARAFQENLPQLMRIENVAILDKAELEPGLKPVSPKPLFYTAVVSLLAMNTAIAGAILRETLNRTIDSERMAETEMKLPVLGSIPKLKPYSPEPNAAKVLLRSILNLILRQNAQNKNIVCLDDAQSPAKEAFRALRTSIRQGHVNAGVRTILVTSPLPQEGKTTVSANLGVVAAQEGKQVLLIDCDLRNPHLHNAFGVPNESGIAEALTGQAEIDELIIQTSQDNLYLIPGGKPPKNPADVLAKKELSTFLNTLNQFYDLIIIDTAPVIPVTDGQILGRLCDTVILVIRSAVTPVETAKKAKTLLERAGATFAGIVLNDVNLPDSRCYR